MKDQAQALGVVPERQFQFRGMASAPEVRGMGCADAVMRAMIDHVRGETPAGVASLLWCNARVSAVGFYQRFGMRVAGAEFDIPGIGPHVVMTVLVEPIGAKA
jgi:predicted GNAT family N-acyltransferase